MFEEHGVMEIASFDSTVISRQLSLLHGLSDSLAAYTESSSYEEADAAVSLPADSQTIFGCTEEQEIAIMFAPILIDSVATLPKPTDDAGIQSLVLNRQGCVSRRTLVVTQSVAYSECVFELKLERSPLQADGGTKRDIMRELAAFEFELEEDRYRRVIKRDHSNRAASRKPSLESRTCKLLEKIAKIRAELILDKQRLREAARVRPTAALHMARKR